MFSQPNSDQIGVELTSCGNWLDALREVDSYESSARPDAWLTIS